MRRVFIETLFKLHSGYHRKELLPYPPNGYSFVSSDGLHDRFFSKVSSYGFSNKILESLSYELPFFLLKSYFDGIFRKPPESTDLTFSAHHLVFRQEPWILESGRIWDVVGYNLVHFRKYRPLLESKFSSNYCKKVLFFTDFARRTCLSALDCTDFAHKVDVLPRAVHRKSFAKTWQNEEVRILFVGSGNLAGQFEYRGGREVMEVFSRVARYKDNARLIIRSDVPQSLMEKYSDLIKSGKIVIISQTLPQDRLELLFESCDIFFFPSHYESWQIVLEASSFEMPVLALNIEGTGEVVEDGRTGCLVKESDSIPQSVAGIPLPTLSPQVRRAILRGPFQEQLAVLEQRLALLIESDNLRRKMGAAGRSDVERGKHSIEYRNGALKRVFDEALS